MALIHVLQYYDRPINSDTTYTQFKATQKAVETLFRGFTTIRDASEHVFGLQCAIDQGILPGPRIYPSSSIISQTGGHGDFRAIYENPYPLNCCRLTHTEQIGTSIIADGMDAITVTARNNIYA